MSRRIYINVIPFIDACFCISANRSLSKDAGHKRPYHIKVKPSLQHANNIVYCGIGNIKVYQITMLDFKHNITMAVKELRPKLEKVRRE